MKILMVHNYYQQRGGEDTSTEIEIEQLRQAGHHVDLYSVHNDEVVNQGLVRTAFRTVWSVQSYRDVYRMLKDGSHDVMHVQNFFPLISPSVYYAAKRCGIPVVQSVRNYRMFCLNGCFFIQNEVCERCFKRKFAWPGVTRRCYRNSFAGSFAVAVMQFVHGCLLRTWARKVDGFIALSDFVQSKLIEAGIDESKITVKPNSVFPEPPDEAGSAENYFIYVGRLSEEKGCRTLLAAWERFRQNEPSDSSTIKLLLVGDGPLRRKLESMAGPTVDFLGYCDQQETLQKIRHAIALIFPSEWYETFGRVAMEAYAVRTPVIASRIGAVKELVKEGETGLLFSPGDDHDLAEKIEAMVSFGAGFSEACRRFYEDAFFGETGLNGLLNVYAHAVGR